MKMADNIDLRDRAHLKNGIPATPSDVQILSEEQGLARELLQKRQQIELKRKYYLIIC